MRGFESWVLRCVLWKHATSLASRQDTTPVGLKSMGGKLRPLRRPQPHAPHYTWCLHLRVRRLRTKKWLDLPKMVLMNVFCSWIIFVRFSWQNTNSICDATCSNQNTCNGHSPPNLRTSRQPQQPLRSQPRHRPRHTIGQKFSACTGFYR